ncbi:MAG TPA: hypothetical protein VF310_16770 [Vicinamibacteria bacterium]|jgi:hypothetical protein
MDEKGDRDRGAGKAEADARSAAERRIALELEIQHLKARVAALKDDIDALERHLES